MLQTLSALAEPNRFRIVELLRQGPRAVNDIAAGLELYQVQVSKHLRVLKAAGVVEVQARAQQRVYGLRAQPLRELHAWLESYRTLWEDRFAELDEVVAELGEKEKSNGPKRKK
jgi:DNA-binding transcriptional ArsR family regulator